MGLFDQVAGMVLGGQSGKMGEYEAIFSWVESQGGIHGLLDKFKSGGLGNLVQSWVGTGNNLPVSTDQIQAVLGSSAVQQLAEKMGINSTDASAMIASYLPKIIDGLSPQGEVASHPDLLSEGLNLLKGKLFG